MKYSFLFFIMITSFVFSQTRIKSFVTARTEVYSYPHIDSASQKIFHYMDDVIITDVVSEFYKVESIGYIKKEFVHQNDSIVSLNFTLIPEELKTIKDSIKSYVRFSTNIYKYPDKDSLTDKSLKAMTDVIVTESFGDFYKIYGYGYIQNYTVFKNEDLKLFDQGLDKEQRKKYREELELARLQKEQEELKQQQLAYEQRKKDLIKKFGKKNAERILEEKVWIGMTKEMVRESWGAPQDINRTITSYGVHEQWVYWGSYLYFEDGKLTTIQD